MSSAATCRRMRGASRTVRESRAMMEDPNARVFVLFLDTYHVEVDGSHRIRKPLVDALDKIIGADDLVGVMTPEMSAGDVTFARKTTTIDGFLTRYWTWGERERINSIDPMRINIAPAIQALRRRPAVGVTPAFTPP